MLREWIGDRHIKSMQVHNFTILNRKFESTISVAREKIEDDQYGIFAPVFQQMRRMTAAHPDTLIFPLLKSGFTESCCDGQFFFDTNHPSKDEKDRDVVVSNCPPGTGQPWFFDRCVAPLQAARLSLNDPNVVLKDEYIFGVRGAPMPDLGCGNSPTAQRRRSPWTTMHWREKPCHSSGATVGSCWGFRPQLWFAVQPMKRLPFRPEGADNSGKRERALPERLV